MPAKRYPDSAVSAAFPELTSIQYFDAGSYKTVYRAITAAGKEEMLKVIPLPQDETTDDARALRQQELGRVLRETSVLSACISPYLVRLASVAPGIRKIEGEVCFAYSEEKLPGSSLEKVIARGAGAKPSEAEVKMLLRCLVFGIQTLWTEHKTVHRDIKPANIFSTLLSDRPYVLLDLGIAYNVTEPGLTVRADHFPHTPLYMAPEMVDAHFRDTLSYRADLYSAGVSAFEFASGGIHPLAKQGETLGKTYYRVLTQEPLRLASQRPDFSPELCTLIDQFLKKKPALRPGNFALILNQLA
ncbi:MAG: protein kinase [Opitutaceae bacterium]|jgi:serine/threonine protein kinase